MFDIEYAIRLINVKKQFRIYYDKGTSLKERALFKNRNRYEERVVLKGINLDVKKGEAVGLIGKNGCGKSTTLKLINKIMYPDAGEIQIRGRISSLIELGAGFHPDMTGRENIYTNAAIFGLKRKEIDERLETIIDFSELGEYIDNPVRTYSSGMYMRLAFSVAINVDADILLIDEILAVGDANFQAKCFNKLREIKANGTTIVIVSHSLSQIEQICDRSIWIDCGEIRLEGNPNSIHPQYMEYMGQSGGKPLIQQGERKPENSIKEAQQNAAKLARIKRVTMLDKNGKESKRFKTGEAVTLCIEYEAKPDELVEPFLGLLLFRNDGVTCYGTNTQRERLKPLELRKKGCIMCDISKLLLVPGSYWFDIAIRKVDMFAYDYCRQAVSFTMFSDVDEVGVARQEHTWRFE